MATGTNGELLALFDSRREVRESQLRERIAQLREEIQGLVAQH